MDPRSAAVVVVPEEEKKVEDVAVPIEGETEEALDVRVSLICNSFYFLVTVYFHLLPSLLLLNVVSILLP